MPATEPTESEGLRRIEAAAKTLRWCAADGPDLTPELVCMLADMIDRGVEWVRDPVAAERRMQERIDLILSHRD